MKLVLCVLLSLVPLAALARPEATSPPTPGLRASGAFFALSVPDLDKRFGNEAIRAEVVQRMVMGRFVVDHERITAPPAKGEIDAVAIDEVKDGKMASVSFLSP